MEYYSNNSYRQMHALLGAQTSLNFPQKLYIDLTQDCNMYCVMCRDELSITGRTMTRELYERIIDETAGHVASFSLFNWGEPLLVPDFLERVAYLAARKRAAATIDISTNGVLLNKEMIAFLEELDVIVTVSFDGADRATFEAIRRGGSFERICRNLKNLASSYSERPLHKMPGIYVTIQKDNQDQLLAIAKLANELGIKRMGFGLVTNPKQYRPQVTDELREMLRQTKAYLHRRGMLNDLYPTKVGPFVWAGDRYQPIDNYLVDKTCNAPLISASIAYNGDVYLCCNIGALVGNLQGRTFQEIWNNREYERLRGEVNDEKLMPPCCKECAWFNR